MSEERLSEHDVFVGNDLGDIGRCRAAGHREVDVEADTLGQFPLVGVDADASRQHEILNEDAGRPGRGDGPPPGFRLALFLGHGRPLLG